MYWHPTKWLLFAQLVGVLLLIFSPALIFAIFRHRLLQRVSKPVYYALWAAVFIAYPILLEYTPIVHLLIPVDMKPEVVTIIGLQLAAIDLLTQPNHKLSIRLNSDRLKKRFTTRWLAVIIFLLIGINFAFKLATNADGSGHFLTTFVQILVVMGMYYLFYLANHYILINQVYRKYGILYYAFAFLGLVMIFFLPIAMTYFYMPDLRHIFRYNLGEHWIGPYAPVAFWSLYPSAVTSIMILTIPIIILIQWLDQRHRISDLQQEKTATELSLLKQQINPHFFFNTLNNVYSMSLTKDEQTPAAILGLSELMRYVIYQGQENTVPLADEVKYIEDYLTLQKLRHHQEVDIVFDTNIENMATEISPLLLIILIENAFKHGIEPADDNGYIHMQLHQEGGQLTFDIRNSVEATTSSSVGGLGLVNLQKRLSLSYPDRHTLSTGSHNQGTEYRARLTLQL